MTPPTTRHHDDPGRSPTPRQRRPTRTVAQTITATAVVTLITAASAGVSGDLTGAYVTAAHVTAAHVTAVDLRRDYVSPDDVPLGEGTTVAPPGEGTPTRTRSALAIPAGWPRGVDISSWQHPGSTEIGWNAVRSAGIDFVVIKATEGNSYTNPYFATDRDHARQAGLAVGVYHYARPMLPITTAIDQADRFLAITGPTRSAGQLAPVLDLEARGGLSADQLAAWAQAFLEEIETKTGRAPILYTYRSFWTDVMKNTTLFSRYPLWFAIYNAASSPGPLPGGWQKWSIWQYTSSASVPGIAGNIDMNVFCCSAGSLALSADGRASEIDKRYNAEARVRSLLAVPIRNEGPAGGGGRWRQFQKGLLFWSVATDVHEVHGGISVRYLALGGSNSLLGRPTSDEVDAEAAGSRQSVFQGGRIYWSRSTGAHEVHGSILRSYLAFGAAGSDLGLPISDEYSVDSGRESAFQYGWLRWDEATNSVSTIRP
ncbi:GH25 family lysozyme [Frankia sp. Cas3]|uniref:GH25 family lysozyme n=1 Tax=Frankia sp. Cas3 TaxID=3073926 RepID=UPI002AD32E7A|nr:GH25 family lysozyme [Frankia sp. Cas3]